MLEKIDPHKVLQNIPLPKELKEPDNNQCQTCGGIGYLYNEDKTLLRSMCVCQKEKLVEYKLHKRFNEVPFITELTPINEAQKICKTHYINNPKSSFFLFGKTGTGKTFISASIFKTKIFETPFPQASFYTVGDIFFRIFDAEDLEIFLKELKERKTIIIDDFGKIKPSEWMLQNIYMIIDLIYSLKPQVVFTSNLSLEQLSFFYSPFIARRIEDCVEYLIEF